MPSPQSLEVYRRNRERAERDAARCREGLAWLALLTAIFDARLGQHAVAWPIRRQVGETADNLAALIAKDRDRLTADAARFDDAEARWQRLIDAAEVTA